MNNILVYNESGNIKYVTAPLSDGKTLKIQWGYNTKTGQYNTTLPISYTSTNTYSVIPASINYNNGSRQNVSKTASSFETTNRSSATNMQWVAIGY